MSGFQRLKPIESEDYRALVDLADEVEAAYCQLRELDHLNILAMRDVDHISKFLLNHHEVFGMRSRDCSQISTESAREEEVP